MTYFTREAVTPDNQGVLVASNRTGKWLPFVIYPDEKRMRCLCITPMHSWSSPGIGGNRVVYMSADGRLGYVPLEGGKFRAVTELPSGMNYSEATVSACGRYTALIYSERLGRTARNLLDDTYPSSLSEALSFGPRSVVLRVDLDTGLTKGLTGGVGALSHPMISPANSAWIEYCSTVPWRQGQRMFFIRYYKKAFYMDVRPLFRQKPGFDAVGHELFLRDGRLAAVWMRFAKLNDGMNEPRESFILVVDPVTEKFKAFRTPGLVYNHLHGRDGKVFVSEGRSDLHLGKPPKLHPQQLDLLCRYDVKGDRTVATALCTHGCTWKGRLGHPHAVVDRENKWCYFNSDRDGKCNVYQVKMSA